MAHYAKVLEGKVIQVIVAEEDFFDTFVDTSPGDWIKTSYNTHEGVHTLDGTPLRKNFAGVGYTYDPLLDAFIPPKPAGCDSWVLNEETCMWQPPTPYPNDGQRYTWNDPEEQWEVLPEDDEWMDQV